MRPTRLKTIETFIGILYLFCLTIGYIGVTQYFDNIGEPVSFWNKLYLILQLFVINFSEKTVNLPVLLNVARFLAPLLLAGTILNLFFSTLINRTNLFIIKYRYKNHIVFCGLGHKSYLLILDYLKVKGNNIVAIEKDPANIYLNSLKNRRLRFIVGNAENQDILKKAGITKSSVVFALTENDKTNIHITKSIIDIFSQKDIQKSIKIILHISDYYNMTIFKEFQERSVNNIDFNAFNIYQKIATNVVSKYCPDQYVKLNSQEDPQCHILIHGLNNIGEYIVSESVQLYHFANLKQLKITIVDDKIEQKSYDFTLKFPFIDKIAEFVFINDIDLFKGLKQENLAGISLCFICCETQSQSYETAKRYRQLFYKLQEKNAPTINTKKNCTKLSLQNPQIVILSQKDPGILDLFENVNSVSEFLNIHKYAFYDDTCSKKIIADSEEIIDNIAMQNHNLYLKAEEAEILKIWDKLTEKEKDANRYPARHLAIKLRYLGAALVDMNSPGEDFNPVNLSDEKLLVLAKMEHNRWTAEKILTGYRNMDEISDKDFELELKNKLRLHTDIGLWEDLSEIDQAKDSIILDNIQSIVSAIGKKLIYLKTA